MIFLCIKQRIFKSKKPVIGMCGQDNKDRLLTIKSEITFFLFELNKKNRSSMKLYFLKKLGDKKNIKQKNKC
jgi:hypothetical protein